MTKSKGKSTGASSASSYDGIGGKIRQFRDFFEESKVEIKKVTWPSRKETIATSIAVIVFTVVVSIFLGLVDFGLSKLISVILS